MFKKARQPGTETPSEGQDASVRISMNTSSGQEPKTDEPQRVVPAYGRLGGASSVSPAAPESKGARLHVGEGLKLEGKVEDCELLTIDGTVSADVVSKDLKIGRTGKMSGDARVETAHVNGNFDGTLTVSDLLSVGAQGCVRGKMTYGALSVENGGQVIGEMIAEEKEAPRESAGSSGSASGSTSGGSSGSTHFLTKSTPSGAGGAAREGRRTGTQRSGGLSSGGVKAKQP